MNDLTYLSHDSMQTIRWAPRTCFNSGTLKRIELPRIKFGRWEIFLNWSKSFVYRYGDHGNTMWTFGWAFGKNETYYEYYNWQSGTICVRVLFGFATRRFSYLND